MYTNYTFDNLHPEDEIVCAIVPTSKTGPKVRYPFRDWSVKTEICHWSNNGLHLQRAEAGLPGRLPGRYYSKITISKKIQFFEKIKISIFSDLFCCEEAHMCPFFRMFWEAEEACNANPKCSGIRGVLLKISDLISKCVFFDACCFPWCFLDAFEHSDTKI